MIIDLEEFKRLKELQETCVSGLVVSWNDYQDILNQVGESRRPPGSPLFVSGMEVFPCTHLKPGEIYKTFGRVKAIDALGFINFCETVGFNWRVIIAAVDETRKK